MCHVAHCSLQMPQTLDKIFLLLVHTIHLLQSRSRLCGLCWCFGMKIALWGIQRAPRITSNHPEAIRNYQHPSTAHQQYMPKKLFCRNLSRSSCQGGHPPPNTPHPPPLPPLQCIPGQVFWGHSVPGAQCSGGTVFWGHSVLVASLFALHVICFKQPQSLHSQHTAVRDTLHAVGEGSQTAQTVTTHLLRGSGPTF